MTERRRTADAPRVVVVDIGVDAALYSEPGNRVLVLRPGQTFNNAVAAVQRCLPHSHPDTVRAIVRTNLPTAPDFDPPDAPPLRPAIVEPEGAPSRWRRPWSQSWTRRWGRTLIPVLAAVLAVIVIGAVGVFRLVSDSSDGPFASEAFLEFARRGEFVCQQTGELQATCRDPRDGVLVSEATVGPRSVVYMFSYGEDRVGLRVFTDAKSARAWAGKPPTRRMYPGVRAVGRFVLWGTDKEKIAYYVSLLRTSSPAARDDDAEAPQLNFLLGVTDLDPVVLAQPNGLDRRILRTPVRIPDAPRANGLPASLGAVMMATLGVGEAEADRAAHDGLEAVLPPVQVLAVRLTLGVPGSTGSQPGEEGPSDDAPIDTPDMPTDTPTGTPTSVPTEPSTDSDGSTGAEDGDATGDVESPAPEPTETPASDPPAESEPEPSPSSTSEPSDSPPSNSDGSGDATPDDEPSPTPKPTSTETATTNPEPEPEASTTPSEPPASEPDPVGSPESDDTDEEAPSDRGPGAPPADDSTSGVPSDSVPTVPSVPSLPVPSGPPVDVPADPTPDASELPSPGDLPAPGDLPTPGAG